MSVRGKDVGNRGEDIAAAYLEAIGYRILHRNYRFGRLELDLVCYEPPGDGINVVPGQGEIVFAEVKTRSGLGFGRPGRSHIRDEAAAYCAGRAGLAPGAKHGAGVVPVRCNCSRVAERRRSDRYTFQAGVLGLIKERGYV